jgi:hypothetical protein
MRLPAEPLGQARNSGVTELKGLLNDRFWANVQLIRLEDVR